MESQTLLQELGFSDYEARVYVSLAGAGERNGYEVAKAAGLPRANVYAVLERLVERGALRRLDTPQGRRYSAVEPERLLAELDRDHRRRLTALQQAFAEVQQNEAAPPIFNLKDHAELLRQARADIDGARSSLLIAIQPPEAAALAPSLAAARERGIAITTLCMEACAAECGGCQGEIHRHCLAPADGARWLLVVSDEARLVAGEVSRARSAAVATESRLIVELAGSYIRQSVAFATIAGELGERFSGLLSEEARRILDALHPEDGLLARLERTGSEAAE